MKPEKKNEHCKQVSGLHLNKIAKNHNIDKIHFLMHFVSIITGKFYNSHPLLVDLCSAALATCNPEIINGKLQNVIVYFLMNNSVA